MTANGPPLLCYAMIISVQKPTQVIKSNTAGFLRIQRHNRKILKRILKRPQNDFLISTSEVMRNVIAPY